MWHLPWSSWSWKWSGRYVQCKRHEPGQKVFFVSLFKSLPRPCWWVSCSFILCPPLYQVSTVNGFFLCVPFSLLLPFFLHSQLQEIIGIFRDSHKSLDSLLNSFFFKWTFNIFMKVYTLVVFGYCLVPFIMLTYNRWFPILAQFYFFAHVIYIPWQFISPCIPIKKKRHWSSMTHTHRLNRQMDTTKWPVTRIKSQQSPLPTPTPP